MSFNESKDAQKAKQVEDAESGSTATLLVLGRATTHWQTDGPCEPDPGAPSSWWECIATQLATLSRLDYPICEIYGLPLVEAYQAIYEQTTQPFIAYVHDDVSIYEKNWDLRVLDEFDDPEIGAVGFFGGSGHCVPELYNVPFSPGNMGRYDPMSNMRRDAERHGRRETGSQDIAVMDGFGLVVRREVLDRAGGWPVGTPVRYFGYDYWVSMVTRAFGYRVRFVGIDCDHWSGKSLPYQKVIAEKRGLSDPAANEGHWEAHQYLYDQWRDKGVIPYRISDPRRKP